MLSQLYLGTTKILKVLRYKFYDDKGSLSYRSKILLVSSVAFLVDHFQISVVASLAHSKS